MKIAILGFGLEGESAYRYWNSQENELTIHDNDSNKQIPSGVASVLGKDAFNNLDSFGYELLVRSPGLRLDTNHIDTPITTPTNEFMGKCPAPVIGVTGTKGKGTTATLISKILSSVGLRVHLLGNIGTPALDVLSDITATDIVVYELSSFQLYDIEVSPHIAVCLMVTDDHLDWHKGLDEYRSSKGKIFKFQKPSDIAVSYADNDTSVNLAKLSGATTKYSYGTSGDVSIIGDSITVFGEPVVKISEIALLGAHNIQNISAAILACWPYTQDLVAIKKVLTSFKGLPYHIELVSEKNGIKYYNDSFSTNPTSAIAAINCFKTPQVLYFGGYDKKADFSELAHEVKQHNIRKVITYGQTGQHIADTFKSSGVENVEYVPGDNFIGIINSGLESAQPGDVVVFSPACASWGMFSDYKDRGEQFNNIVLA